MKTETIENRDAKRDRKTEKSVEEGGRLDSRRENPRCVIYSGAGYPLKGARAKRLLRILIFFGCSSRHFRSQLLRKNKPAYRWNLLTAYGCHFVVLEHPLLFKLSTQSKIDTRSEYDPHSTEYCRKLSEIFPIFHCNWNIAATFLSIIGKYFIATLQF